MSPFNLIREGTTKVIAQACSTCGRVYLLDDHSTREATECCDKIAYDLRKEREAAERQVAWAAKEAESIAKAPTVAEADYIGPVWADGYGHGDGYFASVADLNEWCDDNEHALPEAVWTCDVKKFALPSARQVIENELDGGEYHEGCEPEEDCEVLQAAIDAYNARQTEESWFSARTRVILTPDSPVTTPVRLTPSAPESVHGHAGVDHSPAKAAVAHGESGQ